MSPRKTPTAKKTSRVPAKQLSNRRNDKSEKRAENPRDSSGSEYDFLSVPHRNKSPSSLESIEENESEEQNVTTATSRTTRSQNTTLQNQSQSNVTNKQSKKTPKKRKQAKPKRRQTVLKEVIRLQQSTELLIPKLPFQRVVREVIIDIGGPELRITASALQALQESAEMYAVQLFEDSYLCTMHRTRVTLNPRDMQLARVLRGIKDPGNR